MDFEVLVVQLTARHMEGQIAVVSRRVGPAGADLSTSGGSHRDVVTSQPPSGPGEEPWLCGCEIKASKGDRK